MSKDVERMQGLPKPVWAAGGQWWAFEATSEQSFGPARILRGPDCEGGLAFDDAGRRGAYQADLLNDSRWVYLGDGERPGVAIDDQKTSSPDQKDPSPMDADQRRRMRETAVAAAREAPGEWRTGDKGPPFFRGFSAVACEVEDEHGLEHRILLTYNHHFDYEACARFAVETQPSAVLALLDALDEAERERDALREKLAAAERRAAELEERDNNRRNATWEENGLG